MSAVATETLLKFSEVCKLLRISLKTGKKWMARNNFPPATTLSYGLRATRRWRSSTVEEWLSRREQAP